MSGVKAPNLAVGGLSAEQRSECRILDFTSQGIQKIEIIPNADPVVVILDRNSISKIENLEYYQHLEQLSISDNQLVSMIGVAHLTSVTVLNLPGNKIHSIEGIKNLNKLQWLNLAKNCIKSFDNVQGLTNLQHFDLSDNVISQLGDLSHLTQLKTLLLHCNEVSTLRTAPSHLPDSLTILSLAENNISDLNEVCHLTHLANLEQLSLMNNPCMLNTSVTIPFDYRPFVLNWCLSLQVLDGCSVTDKERLKAEWLFSQGKGRQFNPGQHLQLVQYLASVCPLAAITQPEDAKLARVLQQQKVYQQKLQQENPLPPQRGQQVQVHQEGSPLQCMPAYQENTPPQSGVGAGRPGPVQSGSPNRDSPRMGGRRVPRDFPDVSSHSYDVGPASVYGGLYRSSPYKAWSGYSSPGEVGSRPNTAPSSVERPSHLSYQSHPQYHYPRRERYDMQAADDSDEVSSVLEAETRFLPLHSELSASPLKPFNLEYFMSQRPKTAPSSNDAMDKPAEAYCQRADNKTPSCGSADPCKDSSTVSESKYEHLEDKFSSKPAVSVTRRIAANFSQIPTVSHGHVQPAVPGAGRHSGLSQPKVIVTSAAAHPAGSGTHSSAPDRFVLSPGSHGHLEPQDDMSEFDGLSTDSSQASLELKLLKALMDKRSSEKKHKKSSNRKSREPVLQRPGDGLVSASRSSLSELPHKTQYTPEKYKSPSRRSRNNLHPDGASGEVEGLRNHPGSGASSGRAAEMRILEELDRINKEDKQNCDEKEKTLAATKLQALWRGYIVRRKDPRVVSARQELRTRRSEDHIKYLESEVERQRCLYEREKQLRSVHLEAMKFLWKEVQELQKWKNSVLMSQEEYQRPQVSMTPGSIQETQITMENIPHIIENLEMGSDRSSVTPGHIVHNINLPMPSTSFLNPTKVLPFGVHMMDVAVSGVRASQKELELEHAYKSLQKQVSQLQEIISSRSQGFQAVSQQSDTQNTDTQHLNMQHSNTQTLGASETITLFTDDILPVDPSDNVQTSEGNIHLSLATRQQPLSKPTAPGELTGKRLTSLTVQLQWQPSELLNTQETRPRSALLGYRVYVNDEAMGMTSADQTKVVLEGLSSTLMYRIYVCAVSVVGDSPKSNVIILAPEQEGTQSRSGTGKSDDHDGDAGDDGPSNQDPSVDKTKEKQPTGDTGSNSQSPGGSGGVSPDGSTAHSPSQDSSQQGNSSDSRTARSSPDRHCRDQSTERRQATLPDSSTPKSAKKHKNHEQSVYEDSGYLTSPGSKSILSSADKSNKVSSLTTSVQDEATKASVLQRLETGVSKEVGNSSVVMSIPGTDGHDDLKGIIGSSPRISEGLTKKLEGSKEIKQAVKSQKRKPSPDHGVPLKAIPSDPDIRDKEASHVLPFGEDGDDLKNKTASKIPVYSGRFGLEDGKLQRKSSLTDSSSEGSKSRKSSLTDSRSRRSSGNDSTKGRKLSSSDQENDGAVSPSKTLIAHVKNQENLKQLLSEATAKIKSSMEKNSLLVAKVKSNTFGADSSSSPLVSSKDQAPQSHTWPKEKSDKCTVTVGETDNEPATLEEGQVPKYPDVMGVKRKNSLTRKLSMRHRHRSGSDSSDGSEQQKKEPKTKSKRHHSSNSSRKSSGSDPESNAVELSSSPEQPSTQYFSRDSRSRKSHHEPRRPKEVSGEKRASSVGPVLHDALPAGPGVIIDKPPLARPPHARLPDSSVTPTSSRQRSKSEQGTSSSGEADLLENSTEQASRSKASPKDKRRSPVKISHRRSASDAAIVPNLNLPDPESPRERRAPPPSTPKQCPSSPRVRRSSSFSKSHSEESTTEGFAFLRQCISLETLKAAKSGESKEKLMARQKKQAVSKPDKSLLVDEQTEHNLTVQEPVLSGASRNSTPPGSKFHRSHSLRETRSKKKESSKTAEAEQVGSVKPEEQESTKPDKYSPKLNCAKKENSGKHGKIKMGSKAEDLFAKLQLKISSNKS